ncbi:hypothetical protein, partial [Burkholderia vietnamiensis]
MKRPLPFLFAGVLIAALLPSASRAEPVPAGAGSVTASVVVPAAGIARPAMRPADLAALLS